MAKLPRAVYAIWLSFDKKDWTLIGKDTDSLSYSLNPDVSTDKNVLGETTVNHSGFTPELAVDTYYARTEDAIYPNIQDIAMNRRSDEEYTAAWLLEAILDDEVKNSDTTTLSGKAWMEKCVVVPQEVGGDTTAFGLPFNVNPNGGRVEGTVSVTERVPTFTEGTASEASVASVQSTKTKSDSLSD